MHHAHEAQLGRSGPIVTSLALGTSALGGLFAPVSTDQAHATVAAALDRGLRYIDTAPLYGFGRSEQLVGEVLALVPRESYVISTKVGRLVKDDPAEFERMPEGMWHGTGRRKVAFDFSRDGIRRSLSESLERLGLDHVDIAYLHDPDDALEQAISEAFPALAELRDEGLVHAIGAGMNDPVALARIVGSTRPDCVLIAGRYTLLDQSAQRDLFPLCVREGVGVVVGGVFNSGILADPVPGARFDYVEAEPAVLERAQQLARICASYGVALSAAAIQFPCRHAAVDSVLTGVRSTSELDESISGFDAPIPGELWDELERNGLVEPHAMPTAGSRR
ncbi:MAG: aldo/keto reductase [Thermoleophilia bacterium]